MKIYIIRHGQTTSDLEDRFGGDYDDHLTEEGVVQANALVEKLLGSGIQIVFSSPKIRAQETAAIVMEKLGCEIKTMDGIRERNAYGILTGKVKSQARESHPILVDALSDYHNTIEGAETYESLLSRVEESLDYISNSAYDTVAIISHGGPIRCLFRDVLKMGELTSLADCAIIELEKNGNEITVTKTNGTSFVN